MIRYHALDAAIDGRDVDELARAAGVPAVEVREILAGGIAPSPTTRDRLARALAANPIELFRLAEHLEDALAGAPTRFVTDPPTLRIIDHRG